MNVGENLIVICGISPRPCIALTVYRAHAVDIAGIDTATERGVEILAVFDTDIGLERKTFDGLNLEIRIAEYTPVAEVVVFGIIDKLHGICEVGTDKLHGTGPLAVDV